MKTIKAAVVALMAGAAVVACSNQAMAQGSIAPASQLGIGVYGGGGSLTGGGLTGQYAFSPSFQAGIELGYAGTTSTSSETGSVTTESSNSVISIGPYARFLFEGVVNPFIQAGFRFAQRSTTQKQTVGSVSNEQTTTVKQNDIYAAFGLEYFINHNVGVHGAVEIINVPTESGQATVFGLFNGRVGVEWFFNK